MKSSAPSRREEALRQSQATQQLDAATQAAPANIGGRDAPCVLWLTGLSGSGKSSLAYAIHATLTKACRRVFVLDGDELREGLCSDLGFSDVDRLENIRRASHVARMLVDAGMVVIAAFITPLKVHRELARSKFPEHIFIEIYCRASIDACESRDTKGLYAAARLGKIQNFSGLNAPYEEPEEADIIVDTDKLTVNQAQQVILSHLRNEGLLY